MAAGVGGNRQIIVFFCLLVIIYFVALRVVERLL